ncbi:AraC family transcriptional regulator N-terminal domain-containing protein [Neptunicella marina]|uniref:AraC family transcriptional regulator n=1 Tax=Neptunicella marina TaxID=2125989 RepID=A0A8J6ISA6_9ALTE|nr:AraC family transcriptional regulator [Neptunicella marina]
MNASLIPLQQSLIPIIDRWSAGHLDYATAIPGLNLFRRETPLPPAFCLIKPSVVLVVQGDKQMYAGDKTYPYDITRFLITSLELPAKSETLSASAEKPCLGLNLELDKRLITEMVAHGEVPSKSDVTEGCVGTGRVTDKLLESFQRLVSLLDEPEAVSALLPGVMREIHYRLLTSDQGSRLRQIASVEGQGYKIAKAIDWLCLHFSEPLSIDALSSQVQMSTTTFHSHFRRLTSMTPLQYQKWLRLNEAKRLMLNDDLDAASAGYKVGYESPSQFNREYSRLFGVSPRRDVEMLRTQLVS